MSVVPRVLMPALAVLAALFFGESLLAAGGIDGQDVKTWMAIPFAGILLSIAVFPLIAPHWWHHHFGKVSLVWSVVGALVLFTAGGFAFSDVMYEYVHIIMLDYVPFIILLLGLFTVAGGIRIKGSLRGSPMLNVMLLLIGTLLASWMGTTGAAMLMIRPMLKANEWRKRKVHLVVFFIFLVCNIGGSLTPLGDPPLFLGFLRGVEFFWTMALLPETVFLTAALLFIFYVFDRVMLSREEQKVAPVVEGETEKFGMEGGINFALLAMLIGAILLSSTLNSGAFRDTKVWESYDSAIALGDERAKDLQAALKHVNAKEFAEAKLLYEKAIETDGKVGAARPKAEEAEPAEAPAADAVPPFTATDEKLKQIELDAALWKPHATGLAGRRDALAKLAAGDTSLKSEELARLVLLDYQWAVMDTNVDRSMQNYKATKGVYLPFHVKLPWANLVRDLIILLLAFISWKITSRESRKKNGFSWFPIVEVAKLFVGIFICIVPALKILQAGVNGELSAIVNAVTDPAGNAINSMYFWLTGILSSFLDNAPTYLVFFNTAGGDPTFLMGDGASTLLAVSMGAVFMGANTYIGNAPNFMVKAIAEEGGIKMPSFFGYMLWSGLILIPLFVVVMWIAGF